MTQATIEQLQEENAILRSKLASYAMKGKGGNEIVVTLDPDMYSRYQGQHETGSDETLNEFIQRQILDAIQMHLGI